MVAAAAPGQPRFDHEAVPLMPSPCGEGGPGEGRQGWSASAISKVLALTPPEGGIVYRTAEAAFKLS